MPESRDSLLAHYGAMRAQLKASIQGLGAARMSEATIDGWSVNDNLVHIAFWDDLRADEITRVSAGHASVLRMTPAQDHELNEMTYELRRGLSLAQVMWELEHSGERLFAAIAAAPAEALEPERYGEAGLVSSHGAAHAGYIADWRRAKGY